MEPRLCLRSPLKLPVTVSFGDKEIHCICRDFSLGGMYLETDQAFVSMGANAEISFSLNQGQQHKWHNLRAKIAHTKADGMGVSFQHIDKPSFDTLQKLLKFSRVQNLH